MGEPSAQWGHSVRVASDRRRSRPGRGAGNEKKLTREEGALALRESRSIKEITRKEKRRQPVGGEKDGIGGGTNGRRVQFRSGSKRNQTSSFRLGGKIGALPGWGT